MLGKRPVPHKIKKGHEPYHLKTRQVQPSPLLVAVFRLINLIDLSRPLFLSKSLVVLANCETKVGIAKRHYRKFGGIFYLDVPDLIDDAFLDPRVDVILEFITRILLSELQMVT